MDRRYAAPAGRTARASPVFGVGLSRRRSVPQEGEDGQDAAVVVLAVGQLQLLEDRLDVALDGARAEGGLAGDGAVRPAFGDERQHLALALGEGVEQGAAAPADE